ncbi:class I SAM-dependent methyltransferase [Glutamicibacter sp. NPDC087344]|uniref:class I SAM-dependent methyltransferase n=1 Tax=Glutamicibacter sp. NPDC087344 TaxID=3363994 RepID=UPI003812F1A7
MEHHHVTEELRGVDFWENHYGTSERVWSGKVNQVIERLVTPLTPGTSLDLGCGEGGDVMWLASKGWQATGVDISPTAVQRAETDAAAHGLVPPQATFIAADLSEWTSTERYDLVTLSFFQAPFDFDRAEILRKASLLVAPGGHLLALSHAARPSWAPPLEGKVPPFPTPQTELDALALDSDQWDILQAEIIERQITDPNGNPATLEDTVVFVQRRN